MIHLCDTDVDFQMKEPEHDVVDQRNLYQVYHQQVFSGDEDPDQTIICNTLVENDHVNLRKPSKEEIDQITSELVAQVHSNYNLRNRVVNAVPVKPAGLFMKDTPVKKTNEVHKNVPEFPKAKEYTTKRWDPKKKVHFQEVETTKIIVPNDDSKPENDKQKESPVYQPHVPKVVKSISYDPVDMVSILSQISVKVPLSEMFRIEEHKRKAFSWLEEIGEYSVPKQNPTPNQHASVSDNERKEEIISQIPQMYLDNSSVAYLQDIDPFFLSLIIKGRTLKNCMIDSGASNNIMPLKVMEALGLGVDTRQGRCRAMDAKEIPIVGTINALPFRLAAYPDEELTMSFLVVDIPPHYGMLLSRKWSAAMGGSLQCDLSYATFQVGDRAVKVSREPRVTHIFEQNIDKDTTCFLDTDVNAFRAELVIQEVEKLPALIEQEVITCMDSPKLWCMYFDGANSKEGSGAGVVFVSPNKNTFRYSFSLDFACTNNVTEYEALLLGLKVAASHGIKKMYVIGDSELIISQVKGIYISKNTRLKQYRNVVWDMIESFDTFGIMWKDRTNNKMADLLVNVAIKPDDISFVGVSTIEVQHRPSVPDNVHSWQVFEDDKDILNFLLNKDKYHGQELDCSAWVETVDGNENIFGQDVLQLKTNKVPQGSVVLENVFDNQDRIGSSMKNSKPQELEEINLGTSGSPKKVYIGKTLTPEIRKSLI